MAGALTAAIAAAFSGGGSPPVTTDPYFEYTTLLLPGNGTNGAQNNTFLDGSTNNFTITRNGNTTQGTFSPFSQTGWGNYFDGTGDYLSVASNVALNLTGDYTVECWFYANSFPTQPALFNIGSDAAGLVLTIVSSKVYAYFVGAGNVFGSGGTTLAANSWNHIAIVRSGTTNTCYINGSQSGTTYSSSSTVSSTGGVGIGRSVAGTAFNDWNGYVSNFRVVKGTAVYTGVFTPPTAPLTAITNTSLLTCQSNRFIDNSTNNFTITRNGDTRVVAFSPFNPTASWSAATNGGSGYFDGNGDYLTVPDNAAFDLPGDFTLEGWFYLTNLSVTNGIIGYGSEAASQNGFSLYWAAGSTNKLRIYSNGSLLLTGVTTLSSNSWNHIAVVRSGSGSNNLTVYVNGAVDQTATTTTSFTGVAGLGVGIGVNYDGTFGSVLTGYSTGIRLIKGQALATGAFTPPALPVTTTTVGWNGSSSSLTGTCSLLLNFTNAGIYDATSKNDLETVGNAQISTTQSKFGGSSISVSSGNYLTAPSNVLLPFGTGDFTIEFWAYWNGGAFSTYATVIDTRSGSFTGGLAIAANITTGAWYVSIAAQEILSTTAAAASWQHVAVTRQGTSLKLFVNGTQAGSTYTSSDNFSNTTLRVGVRPDNQYPWNGYIQDLRITKGYARYTANFTPPTAAFPTL